MPPDFMGDEYWITLESGIDGRFASLADYRNYSA